MENKLTEISEKLDVIIKLLAVQTIGDKKGRDAIKLLSNFGFRPKDIAELTGTTSNTVNVALSNMRKNKLKKNAKKQ